jgi:hypothetical protein
MSRFDRRCLKALRSARAARNARLKSWGVTQIRILGTAERLFGGRGLALEQQVGSRAGFIAWGGLLLCAGSAMARTRNPAPEQELAHHVEDTRHDDQLPLDRTQPEPHCLLRPPIRPSRLSARIRKPRTAFIW